MNKITVLTGGAKSGKSRYALQLADRYEKKAFIATAEPFDEEMRKKILDHQQERGASFQTIEEPRDLARAVQQLPAGTELAVIDCLTVWLGNLMHADSSTVGEYPEIAGFLRLLENPPCSLILVTNEVGLGIVPGNSFARRFRDRMGRLNQDVVHLAQDVYFLVSGQPLVLKGESS